MRGLRSLRELFDWTNSEFYRATESAAAYVGHFHEYLVRGGFPQTAQTDSSTQAQRLLREDIIDKVLKRDMTPLRDKPRPSGRGRIAPPALSS